MKRDEDLIFKILKEKEGTEPVDLSEYSEHILNQHKKLIKEDELADVTIIMAMNTIRFADLKSLTSKGHDYIKKYRNDKMEYSHPKVGENIYKKDKGEKVNNSNNILLFISHSSKDEELVGNVVGLLKDTMQILDEQIRCTSLPGHTIDSGKNIYEQIKEELKENQNIVLGVYTDNSSKSSIVLFELGIAWAYDKAILMIDKNIKYVDLPGPFQHNVAIKMNEKKEILKLIGDISKRIGIKLNTPAKLDASVDKYLKRL